MQLIDLYKSRFGAAVKRQGGAWNGPCPLCGGDPGKSDRFMVWPERSESLGDVCASHGVTGIWSCRQCGASGDTIAYLMKVDGLDFKGALAELGIEGGKTFHRRRRAPSEPRRSDAAMAWTPREWPAPSETWSAYAGKLLAEAEECIWKQPAALRWLADRGIDADAVQTYRIGYLPPENSRYPGRWRARTALGLAPRVGDDGRERVKIFIPRGIVIPTLTSGGRVLNLRIRRHTQDLTERSPKYLELEGSCKAPMLLRPSRPSPLAAYFVTEAELDAMLIHHATGGVVGTVAVRTNRGKPDTAAHARLRSAARVCIALDYDAPGADGVDWWEQMYAASRRWPTPEGKDPGDAYRLGVDIRAWVAAALPPSISLPEVIDVSQQDGQMDPLSPGQLIVGGGAEPETLSPEKGREPNQMRARESEEPTLSDGPWKWAMEDAFTPDELCRLRAALPKYLPLRDVPDAVCRAYLLWRGIPFAFCKYRDEQGNAIGYEWKGDFRWRSKNYDRFRAFWRFQEASDVLWQWMSDHKDMVISYKNLLYIWGK